MRDSWMKLLKKVVVELKNAWDEIQTERKKEKQKQNFVINHVFPKV